MGLPGSCAQQHPDADAESGAGEMLRPRCEICHTHSKRAQHRRALEHVNFNFGAQLMFW